jgi:hypothetical protein
MAESNEQHKGMLERVKNILGKRRKSRPSNIFTKYQTSMVTTEVLDFLGLMTCFTLCGPPLITMGGAFLASHLEEIITHLFGAGAFESIKEILGRLGGRKLSGEKQVEEVVQKFTQDLEDFLQRSSDEQRRVIEEKFQQLTQPGGPISKLFQAFAEQYGLDELCPYLQSEFPSMKEQLGKIFDEIRTIHKAVSDISKSLAPSYQKIETYLVKDEPGFTEPQLFRMGYGPRWIDFVNDYVAFREDIIPRLIETVSSDYPYAILEGPPASGKSTILRYIGFLLSRQGRGVWVVDFLQNENPPNEIPKLSPLQENAVLLLDNIHRNPDKANELLGKAKEYKIPVLLFSRPLKDILGFQRHTHLRLLSEEAKKRITLKAVDARDEMIKVFERVKGISLSTEAKNNLSRFSDDLWLFSIALESLKNGRVDLKDIHQFLCKEWLEEHIGRDYKIRDAEVPLLVSAFFSRFEIPLPEEFFTKLFHIREEVLNALSEQGFLRRTEDGRIAHHHSSLANLYISAVTDCRSLKNAEQKIAETLQVSSDSDLTLSLFSAFLHHLPEHGCELIARLRPWDEEQKLLMRSLAEKNPHKIVEAIRGENDVGKIGWCVRGITLASEDVARKVVEDPKFDWRGLIKKLREEMDVDKIGWCVGGIADASKEAVRKIVEDPEFDSQGLIGKLNEEKDVGKIGECVRGIALGSEDAALKLLPLVIEKLKAEKDVEKIGWLVGGIADASEDAALRLVPAVIEKLNEEKDVAKIGWGAWLIAFASEDVVLKLVPVVIEKLNEEKDVEKIGWCVEGIAYARKEVARRIVEDPNFDWQGLIEKLNKEEDVRKIGWCVGGIALASEDVARKIVKDQKFIQGLIKKLKEEKDVEKIGVCVLDIAFASKEVAQKVFQGLEPEVQNILREEFPWLRDSIGE